MFWLCTSTGRSQLPTCKSLMFLWHQVITVSSLESMGMWCCWCGKKVQVSLGVRSGWHDFCELVPSIPDWSNLLPNFLSSSTSQIHTYLKAFALTISFDQKAFTARQGPFTHLVLGSAQNSCPQKLCPAGPALSTPYSFLFVSFSLWYWPPADIRLYIYLFFFIVSLPH